MSSLSAEQEARIEETLATFKEDELQSSGNEASHSVGRATERIRRRLFDVDLTVTRLQERLDLPDRFYARFRHHHGRSPSAYIQHLRVEAAKKLLRYEGLRIADVAFQVGYEHYRTFTRAFKRETGRSPQQFREERVQGGSP